MKKPLLETVDFYLVTDTGLSRRGIISDVTHAVAAGCRIVQYREKFKSTREMIEEASKLKSICKGKAMFLINDHVDVALAVNAGGVHLGLGDMPYFDARMLLGKDSIIGLTVHNVGDAIEAERLGADYIGLSPIFPTSTKADSGKACGLDMIREVREVISIPIVAIGGINKDNVADVIRAGASSAVAISAVVCADDVEREVREFREKIRAAL